ncbi:MAG TPA: N-acetylmannosamine-6-phosphate 2-epimerase [Armatimonadota bacterium]|nr:N-acetylmannosamine-6-phosphate 2-epimerase [Armatimonadota bacterium]
MPELMDSLRGRLIVSCQAAPDSPLGKPETLAALAECAVLGGAAAIRADGPENIRAITGRVDVPVLGIYKKHYEGFEPYITPTVAEAMAVIEAGAKLLAVDATPRPRPGACALADIVTVAHDCGVPVMADCSAVDDARFAQDAGADLLGTTLAGYTPYSRQIAGPDFELIGEIAEVCERPVVAEGRIHSPAEAARALIEGAFAVVVGTAITAPQAITSWYANACAAAAEAVAK